MEKRFGKIKLHSLPFTHMGMTYEVLGDRHLFIHQQTFCENLKKVEISPQRRKEDTDLLDNKELHFLRSVLCSLLWLCQTREDIYVDVVQLQQVVKRATVSHLKQVNSIVDKAQRNKHMAGLHFPPMKYPVRLASVADASHGNNLTSYPQEGSAVFLMEDNVCFARLDKRECVLRQDYHWLAGKTHTMMMQSGKAKRISHSTCHAETNAAYKTNQHAQFTALRFTEVLRCTQYQHKAADMIDIFDKSEYMIKVDHYTDCMDFWQLCCGLKGVPSDKGSRLSILSMREERLSGRLRTFIHIPTTLMIMDGLTKIGIYQQLMTHMTTGIWTLDNIADMEITLRRTANTTSDFSEQDLIDMND